jgi:hypothetical protein
MEICSVIDRSDHVEALTASRVEHDTRMSAGPVEQDLHSKPHSRWP